MNEERIANFVQLVSRLDHEEEVLWDEVEEAVAGFAGWPQMVMQIRHLGPSSSPIAAAFGNPVFQQPLFSAEVSDEKRKTLLNLFLPYGILLDESRNYRERLEALSQAGVDAPRFVTEARTHDFTPIRSAATSLDDAMRQHDSLMRGSERPPDPPTDLLRSAYPGEGKAESLLQPADEPPPVSPRPSPSLLQRLFSRRK